MEEKEAKRDPKDFLLGPFAEERDCGTSLFDRTHRPPIDVVST